MTIAVQSYPQIGEMAENKKTQQSSNVKMAWTFGISGISLMLFGFIVPPMGEISGSVLGGAGELFALVGGLMGIDHSAKVRTRRETNEIRREIGLKEKADIDDEDTYR